MTLLFTFQMHIILLILAFSSIHALPDIFPHEGALFTQHGYLIGGLSWAHITAPINISRMEQDVRNFQQIITYFDYLSQPNKETKGLSEEERKRMLVLKRICDRRLAKMNTVITDLRADLGIDFTTNISATRTPRMTALSRQPRQVVVGLAAIGGMIVGAIAGSLFSQFKTTALIDILDRKVDTVVHQVDDLSIGVYQDHQDITQINKTLAKIEDLIGRLVVTDQTYDHYFTGIYSTLLLEEQSERFNLAQTAIDQLLLGKMHKGLISPTGLGQAIADLNRRAQDKGMLIGVKRPIELYQLHTSFAYDHSTNILHAIIHVPMYRESHVLTLKRYIPVPFLSPSLDKFIQIEPEQVYLAQSSDNTLIKIMDEQDLNSCLNIGHAYFCEDHSLQKSTTPSCLLQLSRGIKRNDLDLCPIQILPQVDVIHQTARDTYIIATSSPTTVVQTCQRNQDIAKKIDPGTYMIRVNRNCTTSSDQWVIYPTLQIENADINTTAVRYDFEIPTLHDDLSAEDLQTIHTLIGTVGKPVPLTQMTQLLKFRKEITRDNAELKLAHLLFSGGTTMTTIMAIIFCGLTGYYIFRKCSKNQVPHNRLQNRNDYELAPMMTAPPASIALQVTSRDPVVSNAPSTTVSNAPSTTAEAPQSLPPSVFTFWSPKGSGSLSS